MSKKGAVLTLGVFVIAGCATVFTAPAHAFDASSTNFFVRQDVTDVAGTSTSAGFRLLHGAGTALGFSTSSTFQVLSGMLRTFFQGVAPSYTQVHYHWRNDDGSETAATSATGGTEDTALGSIAQNVSKRLRIEVANTGGTIKSFSAQQFRLEQGLLSTTCGAIAAWTDVGAATGTWAMAASANLTDGANTTNIGVSTGGVSDGNGVFVVPNAGVKTTASQTGNISVPSNSFVELEYSVKPLASSTASGVYCFRLTNAGVTTNFSYTRYPQATVAVGQSISISLAPGTVTLGGLTPGTPVFATATATVSMVGGTSGYSLKLNRDGAGSTLASSTIAFPDATAWNPGTGCVSGQGNASVSPGQNLSFRVNQAGTTASYCTYWWGSDDTAPNAEYAGIPSASQTVMDCSGCNSGSTDTALRYRADAPATQRATNYTGTITFTAIANP